MTTRTIAETTPTTRPAPPGAAAASRIVPLAGLAVVVGLLALVTSRHGPVLAADTAIYYGTARNLLNGHGLTSPVTLIFTDYFSPLDTVRFHGAVPVTTLPPAYSIALAGLHALGTGLDTAARIVGAGALGVSAALLASMTLRLTGSWLAAAGTTVLFLVAGPLAEAFYPASWLLLSAYALAEVLFLALTLVALLALARLLARGRVGDVWVAGLAAAAVVLCRYLGVALVLTAGVLLVARSSWTLATRLRRIVAYAVLALSPTIAWTAALAVFVGRGTPSTPLRYRHHDWTLFRDGIDNVAHWFVPTSVGRVAAWCLLALVLIGVGAGAWFTLRARDSGPAAQRVHQAVDPLWSVLVAFPIAYVAVLYVSIALFNSAIGFDARLLAPARAVAYVLVVSVAFLVVRHAFGRRDGTSAALVGGAVIAVACVLVVLPFVRPVQRLVRDGAPGSARSSPLLAAVRRLPRGAVIVTNTPDTVWLGAGRRSITVPIKLVPEAGVPNSHYRRDLREVATLLARRDVYLVMFGGYNGRTLATAADIARVVPLVPAASVRDGTIYRGTPAAGAEPAGGTT